MREPSRDAQPRMPAPDDRTHPGAGISVGIHQGSRQPTSPRGTIADLVLPAELSMAETGSGQGRCHPCGDRRIAGISGN